MKKSNGGNEKKTTVDKIETNLNINIARYQSERISRIKACMKTIRHFFFYHTITARKMENCERKYTCTSNIGNRIAKVFSLVKLCSYEFYFNIPITIKYNWTFLF